MIVSCWPRMSISSCVATPDDRHFAAAEAACGRQARLVEKPSVLTLRELDELERLAREHKVLAKVVYHKLLDPDHKKLRTLVADGELSHVNNGYCTLLEPKSISGGQFAEWITGRNPGTYVAVHYIKLDRLHLRRTIKERGLLRSAGLVGPADGPTWDSTQLRLIYKYDDRREAAFDIHTSWVTPDNFPGYVEQEVQFRFDNGVWNAHSRKRGWNAPSKGAHRSRQITMNNHYNGTFLEPWERTLAARLRHRGAGAFRARGGLVEFAGPVAERGATAAIGRQLAYNDISADRQTVAAVQAMEAILARHAAGEPNCVVEVDHAAGGLVLLRPGKATWKYCTPDVS